MSISASLLPEYDNEMKTTRRVLERVPGDRLDWQPHPKSMSMGTLATHLANLPWWGQITMEQDSFDVGVPTTIPAAKSTDEILERFDKNVATVREILQRTEDSTFFQPWTLRNGERTVFTLPKVGVLRTMVFSHIIHHRGQLTVYLRLNDVPVPSVYGPSADEGM